MRLLRYRIGSLLLLSVSISFAFGQEKKSFDLSGHVRFEEDSHPRQQANSKTSMPPRGKTVVWLQPFDNSLQTTPLPDAEKFTIVQQHKMFSPDFLVVPVGSVVNFPNRDPFFHNVFSLFNGRRFDLGLYQSGQTRAVKFSRAGVSYIFCNIHPEMAAVVISLETPYYSIPNANGELHFSSIPVGSYVLHVWSENSSNESLKALERTVTVVAGHTELPEISIRITGNVMEQHLNKFGQPYDGHVPQY